MLSIGISLDGRLVSIESKKPFQFDVFQNNDENQKRYETIGKLIDEAVFEKLEEEGHLQRQIVPVGILFRRMKRAFSLCLDRCKERRTNEFYFYE